MIDDDHEARVVEREEVQLGIADRRIGFDPLHEGIDRRRHLGAALGPEGERDFVLQCLVWIAGIVGSAEFVEDPVESVIEQHGAGAPGRRIVRTELDSEGRDAHAAHADLQLIEK